jgi:hypothetical protein
LKSIIFKIPVGLQPLKIGNNEKFYEKMVAYELIERSHKFWTNLIKNDLEFKNVSDMHSLKLLSTQCAFSFNVNHKNGKEAEEIVEQLKQLIMNRPDESLAAKPDEVEIERSVFLNKAEILEKIKIGEKKGKEWYEVENNESYWWTILKRNKLEIFLPVIAATLLGCFIYYKNRNE